MWIHGTGSFVEHNNRCRYIGSVLVTCVVMICKEYSFSSYASNSTSFVTMQWEISRNLQTISTLIFKLLWILAITLRAIKNFGPWLRNSPGREAWQFPARRGQEFWWWSWWGVKSGRKRWPVWRPAGEAFGSAWRYRPNALPGWLKSDLAIIAEIRVQHPWI